MQGVLFRFGDPAYHFSGPFISLPLLSNYVLFSEVEDNVVQGSKHGPRGPECLNERPEITAWASHLTSWDL